MMLVVIQEINGLNDSKPFILVEFLMLNQIIIVGA